MVERRGNEEHRQVKVIKYKMNMLSDKQDRREEMTK